MTDSQLLQQLIQRAIDGGWTAEWTAKEEITIYGLDLFDGEPHYKARFSEEHNPNGWMMIIYNHGFAKALFGESFTLKDGTNFYGSNPSLFPWQYYLQQLVIHPKPLDYLREWLEGQSDSGEVHK